MPQAALGGAKQLPRPSRGQQIHSEFDSRVWLPPTSLPGWFRACSARVWELKGPACASAQRSESATVGSSLGRTLTT